MGPPQQKIDDHLKHNKKTSQAGQTTSFTHAEEMEAKRLVREMVGNSHDPDRIHPA